MGNEYLSLVQVFIVHLMEIKDGKNVSIMKIARLIRIV